MAPIEKSCLEADDTTDTKYKPLSHVKTCNCGLNAAQNMVLEPNSGIEFPSFISCEDQHSGTSCQVLTGIGINSLTILKIKSIKIYAFGLYIKPDSLRSQLGEKYAAIGGLADNSGILEDLLRCNLDMTLRLVVHYRGLKANMVRSAFESTLRNRLKKIKGVEVDEGLDIFNSYFSDDLSISRGSVIDFQRVSGGQLWTKINGNLIGTISSLHFIMALFDIYIGDPPVSAEAKQNIQKRVCQLLRVV